MTMHLAPKDHFVRYCKPSQCSEDGRVLNLAFRLRSEQDEQSLSGDHFEYFSENPYQNIITALGQRYFTPSPKGKFVKLNCGAVIGVTVSWNRFRFLILCQALNNYLRSKT